MKAALLGIFAAQAAAVVDNDAVVADLFANPAVTCAVASANGFCDNAFITWVCPVTCGGAYTDADYCADQDAILSAQYGLDCTAADAATCVQPAVALTCSVTCGTASCGGGVSAKKDPHLHFAHGGRADLRGEDGAIYNFLSASNVSMNVKTVKADFHWKEQMVHGTRIGAVYWTLKAADGSHITVKYESAEEAAPKAAFVAVDGKPATTVSVNEAFTHQDVRVAHTSAGLNVTDARWTMAATPAHFPYAKNNKKKYLLDIQASPLYNADADPVAPHGIFGQSFDGDNVAVDGARDAEDDAVVERTTKAQAEGAIEGTVSDYKMEGAFATEFKYSRFNGVPAPHRDVSKLTGVKRAGKAKTARATVSAADHDAKAAPVETRASRRALAMKTTGSFTTKKA